MYCSCFHNTHKKPTKILTNMFHHSMVFNEGESVPFTYEARQTLSWTFSSSSDPSTRTQWIVNKWKNHEKRVAAMKMIMRWARRVYGRRNGSKMTFCWGKDSFRICLLQPIVMAQKLSPLNELLQLISFQSRRKSPLSWVHHNFLSGVLSNENQI